jgi:hypothetical protein
MSSKKADPNACLLPHLSLLETAVGGAAIAAGTAVVPLNMLLLNKTPLSEVELVAEAAELSNATPEILVKNGDQGGCSGRTKQHTRPAS